VNYMGAGVWVPPGAGGGATGGFVSDGPGAPNPVCRYYKR